MLDRIRALVVVIEEGSVSRAAARLRIAQPALSRQMKSLENEVGGKLLERRTSGVKPTSLGHALVLAMRPVLAAYDAALTEVRRQSHGEDSVLRVGFIISAAQCVLTPALARLRQTHPGLNLKLHDMSPQQQINALRAGQIDVALTGQEGGMAMHDFHSLKLCSMGVCAALPASDPLAARKSIAIKELKGRDFIGLEEAHTPGRNRWIMGLCQRHGFKPRFVSTTIGITHVLSRVSSESAVTLLPDYLRDFSHPDIVFVPVSDGRARWDFLVLWQRGETSVTARALVAALSEVTRLLARRLRPL